jgi:hypothetical protein
MPRQTSKETRERERPLRVVVSPSERRQIEEKAKATALTVSSYLRATGLGTHLRSVYDHKAVVELCGVAGDLGRLGGLFKLYLSRYPGDREHRRLLQSIEAKLKELDLLLPRIRLK